MTEATPAGDITFERYLRELPATTVFQRLGGKTATRGVLSSAALAGLVARFSRPEELGARFDRLSSDGRRECARAYLLLPRGVEAGGLDGFDGELLGSFLLHAAREPDGRLFYRGFGEFTPLLGGRLSRQMRVDCRGVAPHRVAARAPVHVLNDVALVAMMVGHGLLQRTRGGALATAAAARCRSLLHCARSHWRSDFQKTIALFAEYAVAEGLLVERNGDRRVSREGMTDWLARPLDESYAGLVAFCTSRQQPWHWLLAREAFAADEHSGWYRLAGLGDACAAAAAEGLRLGEALGLFAVVKSAGEIAFCARATESGSGAGPGDAPVLLPDFSALISQETSPSVLAEFCEAGELLNLDNVYRGHLTREALSASLSQGTSGDLVVERLRAWKAPSNVVETVREWVREYERVLVPEEQVLLVSQAGVVEQLRACEALREHVSFVPVNGAFRIHPGRELEVRRILSQLGFDTRAPRLAAPEPAAAEEPKAMPPEESAAQPRLITEFGPEQAPARGVAPRGKYGATLKSLPPSELDHVVDYAMLMGHRLRFEYDGSPWVKRGLYTILPLAFTGGVDGVVEGEDQSTGGHRRFLRGRIRAVGVVSE